MPAINDMIVYIAPMPRILHDHAPPFPTVGSVNHYLIFIITLSLLIYLIKSTVVSQLSQYLTRRIYFQSFKSVHIYIVCFQLGQ